jgi:LysM repeat protein
MDQIAPQPGAAEVVQANISGEISGQVAVGNYNLQIGSVHGGVVNINLPDQRPRLQARPTPVKILPRRISGLLDRVEEIGAAETSLSTQMPVEFNALSGFGKTSLLRLLARRSLTDAYPDGVIYLSARDQRPGDLLQSIFDALFEYDVSYKPSEGEIRFALQNKHALILLDDVELSREEVEGLLDAVPDCTFLLAGPEQKLWGEGRTISLPGLPSSEAQSLLERELGRKLDDREAAATHELWEALDGSPLALIQAAALVRERGYSLERLAAAARGEEPKRKVAALALELLTEPERMIVAAIGTLKGVPLKARHMPGLTQMAGTEVLLDRLQKQGIVQAADSGYCLAGFIPALIEQNWNMEAWRESALNFFRSWAAGFQKAPLKILEEADALLHLNQWAMDSGRWQASLELVRLVEGSLAIGGRWEAWEAALQGGLQAAQTLGNLAEKAWALHQLGTRLLCLGDKEAARNNLIRALRLRTTLGDRAGAAVTRHNLNLLFAPGSNGGPHNKIRPKPRFPLYTLAIGAVLALPVLALAFGIFPPTNPNPVATTSLVIPSSVPTSVPPISSDTPVPPTSPSNTIAPSLTDTALPTSTDTPVTTPTDTSIPSATHKPTRTPVPCIPETGWPIYTVQSSDTLYNIARLAGTTYPRLMAANCLTSTLIRAGQKLYVPRLPVISATIAPTDTATYTPIVITQIPNQLPSPHITTPKGDVQVGYDGYDEIGWYKDLVLTGSAQDLEDGALSGESLVWTTDQTSIQAGELGRGAEISTRLYSSVCRGVTHTITLLAVDSQGARSVDVRRVRLSPKSCTPNLTILRPAAGVFPPDGYDKGLAASYLEVKGAVEASDARNRPIAKDAIVWMTDQTAVQDAILGYGTQPSFRLYLPDTESYCDAIKHNVRIVVTDGEGERIEKTVSITITESCIG